MKKLSISLLFILLFPNTGFAYLDVDSSVKYQEAIDFITDQKIVNGYSDGTYKPNNYLNRAELLKIVMEAYFGSEKFLLIDEHSKDTCFNDVSPNEWYTKYICGAKSFGIIQGYIDNTFKPDKYISLVEALKIVLKTFNFSYKVEILPWYYDLIDVASQYNFIPLDFVDFNQNVNRGQMADIITRILKYNAGELATYLGSKKDIRVTYESLESHVDTDVDVVVDAEISFPLKTEVIFEPTDLVEIWGLDVTKEKSKISCPEFTNSMQDGRSGTYLKGIPKTESGVNVMYFIPNDLTEKDSVVKGGMHLTGQWLKKIQNYFGEYPCSNLQIISHQDYAAGGPGSLGIGGESGFNHYWLLWHELTHSYFGTHSSKALWLREGVSSSIPAFILEDIHDQIEWPKDGKPNLEGDGINGSYEGFMKPNYYAYDEGQVYREKNACDLVEPSDTNKAYKDNSNWGRVFLFDLGLKYGKEPVIDALHAVYLKYRLSDKLITDEDFYDAFLYYMSKNGSGKHQKAKAFLDTKLCK